jgi:hypothetical protein
MIDLTLIARFLLGLAVLTLVAGLLRRRPKP